MGILLLSSFLGWLGFFSQLLRSYFLPSNTGILLLLMAASPGISFFNPPEAT
jgi:hypothetical protein